MNHIYSLRNELNSAWAARPLDFAEYRGLRSLVTEDPGGASLDCLMGRPLDIKQLLRTAIGIVQTLGHFHAQGLVHRDIRPANILVDVATGDAWLKGFGLTSRLPRQHQSADAPQVIAGTLEYMAPEQTGRMNRSVDSRRAFSQALRARLRSGFPSGTVGHSKKTRQAFVGVFEILQQADHRGG